MPETKIKTAVKKPAAAKKTIPVEKKPAAAQKTINIDSLAVDIAKKTGYKIIDKEEFNAAVYDAFVESLANRLYLRDKECRGILEKVDGLK